MINRKILTTALLIATPFFSIAATGTINTDKSVSVYSSKQYIQNQYEILKHTFTDFDVVLIQDAVVNITLPGSYGFKSGRDSLTGPVKDKLLALSDFLNQYPETYIQLHGHTDNIGANNLNKKLSLKRAESVMRQLVIDGVSAHRIKTFAEGSTQPKCTNATAEGRECNRRVELRILLEGNDSF